MRIISRILCETDLVPTYNVKFEYNGYELDFNIDADTDQKAIDWLNAHLDLVNDEINKRYRDTHDRVQVAPDFQIASPPYPKTKDEAKAILEKFKNTPKGEPKSIGEAIQAIMKIME